ncbi:putative mitochondrial protein [Glycine soja]
MNVEIAGAGSLNIRTCINYWEFVTTFILPFVFKPPTRKNHNLGTNTSLHASSSLNAEGSTPKDPLYKILDELRSLKLWKEKQERKEKGKKRVEEISQDEKEKIREEERRKILKDHNSCKSLSEELRDYYEGRHRSDLRTHSHGREKERKPQEANINLSYFHGKDNVEANLDWEIRVEQQLKRKSTSKFYGSHSYPKKDQGQGILGVTPSKPKDDKGKTIEKQPLKASMQEKTSSMKCFKCLGIEHITSQCPTKKTMIMRGQDIYSSQDEVTTSPSYSESEETKGEESSEEIYPQEEGQPLIVKEECKEVSVSSKRLAKKESHFEIKAIIKENYPLRQPPHFPLCKKTLVSIATPLRLEFIPQVKKLLDEGLLVPKIGIIRHQIPKIGGMMNVLSGATLYCQITRAPNIFMICVHRDSLGSFNTNLGTHMGHLRFVILFGRNNQYENTEKGVPMNPKRIKVIPEWPTPPSIRKIWGFHDLTNFYKRFVPYFSILVAPLIELVRNHVPSWEDAQEMGQILFKGGGGMMQSYPARALDRRLQEDWARDAREGLRVLISLREECKEVSVSSKRQPPYFLLCKKTLVSIATPLGLEFIPQVKELLDKGLVRKSLNPCALLVPKIGIKPRVSRTLGFEGEGLMQSYPVRALDRSLQEDWVRDAREGPRVIMSLRVDFGPMG